MKIDLTSKSRFMANASKTEAPVALPYLDIVSMDNIWLAFLIAALNELDVMACDIGNAYINAPYKKKICFKEGEECGDHQGTVMILVRSIYGLKTSGASWR